MPPPLFNRVDEEDEEEDYGGHAIGMLVAAAVLATGVASYKLAACMNIDGVKTSGAVEEMILSARDSIRRPHAIQCMPHNDDLPRSPSNVICGITELDSNRQHFFIRSLNAVDSTKMVYPEAITVTAHEEVGDAMIHGFSVAFGTDSNDGNFCGIARGQAKARLFPQAACEAIDELIREFLEELLKNLEVPTPVPTLKPTPLSTTATSRE
ncbi:MAG: hypothetical protein AAB588_03240 [Patescibacteria group bacterium]